jgi:hypothetical protein
LAVAVAALVIVVGGKAMADEETWCLPAGQPPEQQDIVVAVYHDDECNLGVAEETCEWYDGGDYVNNNGVQEGTYVCSCCKFRFDPE